ncbi:hypothetical protein NCGM2209_0003 [Mycobacterium tuberculosis NCGM2209]|nr:hypothetical protein NCGM2209_0003 [Mycobacterium tuberculosis NCGM2209]
MDFAEHQTFPVHRKPPRRSSPTRRAASSSRRHTTPCRETRYPRSTPGTCSLPGRSNVASPRWPRAATTGRAAAGPTGHGCAAAARYHRSRYAAWSRRRRSGSAASP